MKLQMERYTHSGKYVVHHGLDFFLNCGILFFISTVLICSNTMPDNAGLKAISESTHKFGSNFLKTVISDHGGNLVSSPLSAQVVLAMAAYGAGGSTATQMRSALFIPSENALGQAGYHSLIETLNAVKKVDLRVANKIYTASHFRVNPTFQELTAKKFLSSSQQVDFSDAAAAANIINTWCEEQTNHRIKDIITPDSLEPDTALVLVNAVYFKGRWLKQFKPSFTQDRPFHVDEKTVKNVPTMFIRDNFRFGELPQIQARFIKIPYIGDDLSMIIILPNEISGLKSVQDNLHQVDLVESLNHAHPIEVELSLPKFKIESSLDLKTTLQKLGMTDMFEDTADFSGIANAPLKVSKVIQKAFIEVNEEGSEAAAATTMIALSRCAMVPRDPPTRFKVDRPYYYSIYHHDTGLSLFSGFVQQPNIA